MAVITTFPRPSLCNWGALSTAVLICKLGPRKDDDGTPELAEQDAFADVQGRFVSKTAPGTTESAAITLPSFRTYLLTISNAEGQQGLSKQNTTAKSPKSTFESLLERNSNISTRKNLFYQNPAYTTAVYTDRSQPINADTLFCSYAGEPVQL